MIDTLEIIVIGIAALIFIALGVYVSWAFAFIFIIFAGVIVFFAYKYFSKKETKETKRIKEEYEKEHGEQIETRREEAPSRQIIGRTPISTITPRIDIGTASSDTPTPSDGEGSGEDELAIVGGDGLREATDRGSQDGDNKHQDSDK